MKITEQHWKEYLDTHKEHGNLAFVILNQKEN